MQYEIVIKGDRWCSCYSCLPRTTPAAAQTGRRTAAPGTGTRAPPVGSSTSTHEHMAKNKAHNKHTRKH